MTLRRAPILAIAVLLFACGHDAKPPQDATSQPTSAAVTAPKLASRDVVSMSDDLKALCHIDDTRSAPKFDFDSSSLSESDRSALAQLAKCMSDGPLKGKDVELVGRADPRGEAEYNMNLGATRAHAVRAYLGQLGIATTRLPATSRGALDARGSDESSWAEDRRVDLRIAGR